MAEKKEAGLKTWAKPKGPAKPKAPPGKYTSEWTPQESAAYHAADVAYVESRVQKHLAPDAPKGIGRSAALNKLASSHGNAALSYERVGEKEKAAHHRSKQEELEVASDFNRDRQNLGQAEKVAKQGFSEKSQLFASRAFQRMADKMKKAKHPEAAAMQAKADHYEKEAARAKAMGRL